MKTTLDNATFTQKFDFVSDYVYAQKERNDPTRIMVDEISYRDGSTDNLETVVFDSEQVKIEAVAWEAHEDENWMTFESWSENYDNR